ncbi:MAG: hypothetical protein QG653_633 [Patescibacteria group bacterium]|nr:hypothetical protein [Patescibacteria group bacterium]
MFYIVLVLVLSSVTYSSFFFSPMFEVDRTYLSSATFLFSVFNGFFIARQANRYNDVRNLVSKIDANLSIIYRESTHIGGAFTKKIGSIILGYYEMRKKGWNDYIMHKSTTIADFHKAIDAQYKKANDGIKGEAMRKMMLVIDDMQIQRKALITLNEEKVTRYQYTIVFLLAVVLVAMFLSLDTSGHLVESFMKGVLISVVGVVVWMLHKFDELHVFEGVVGEHSARDVIDIIAGNK